MQKWIDFKNKKGKYIRILQNLKNRIQGLRKYSQKGVLVNLLFDIKKIYYMIKVGFFQKNQLGIGLSGRKWAEMGQKWPFLAKS